MDTEMRIKGLKLHIETDKLHEKLDARARYHHERAQQKRELLPELQAVHDKLKDLSDLSAEALSLASHYSTGADRRDFALETLKQEIQHHERQRERLTFIAEHLAADAMYILTERDFKELDLLR